MHNKNNLIALFDIDWTLINGLNRMHSESFRYIFKHVFRLENINVYDIRPHGMTDLQIIFEILRIHNLSALFTKKRVNMSVRLMGNYYVENSYKEQVTLMPGVIDLLNTLKKRGYLMGILSGNIERIGKQKLVDALISEYFSFGAFGDMSVSRSELVDFAEINMQKNGIKAQKNQFVIIGDSVRDIECAKNSKLPSIGVATGSYSNKEIQLAGANLAVNTLKEVNSVMRFFSHGR
ncbi:MAG: HAD family hydrolase [Patescibacteria group bacterium]